MSKEEDKKPDCNLCDDTGFIKGFPCPWCNPMDILHKVTTFKLIKNV